jgi:uncharacterized spore protein YtfJ
MDIKFNEIISKITDFMESEAKTETVVGDPFQLGEFSCIPVIRLGLGFGTGGGEGDVDKQNHGEGAGAGAGMGIEPVGFLASRGEQISFISTRNHKGLDAAFEKVPDLLMKYMETTQKEKAVNN